MVIKPTLKDRWEFDWKYRLLEARCWLSGGHRRLTVVAHADICERPWDKKHLATYAHTEDAWCFSCDKSNLVQDQNGKWW